ncbi:MAG: pantothenate kinase, partial [Candidatus Omnitrophica bacterium]|nr:pantothenate kinase [Candidatus Omnitrophota bacterium]
LPKLKLAKPKDFIGQDTINSILGGLTYGFAILVDGLIQKIKEKVGAKTKVILTGGDAEFLFPYCKNIDILDPDLIIKGLNLCYEQILKK